MDVDLTTKEAFRLGFLARCAEEGLTGDALQTRINAAGEKQAAVDPATLLIGLQGLGSLGRGAWEGAKSLALNGGKLMFGVPAAAGLAAGGLGGYALAKFNEPNITDDDIKAQEIADAYRTYAQRLKTRRKFRTAYRPAR